MEFFQHPWSMAFGGILVSAPILIHLINRMRFKRVRWAAMEFLLKSQKKNRRRMIIEQLILLLLRILLVLLAAFLVARYLFGGAGPKGASHLILIDDTLSMGDLHSEGGKTGPAYAQARLAAGEVARSAAKANAAQNAKIFLLTEMDKAPVYDGRLGSTSKADIDSAFSLRRADKPTLLAGSALAGLRKARKYFSEEKGTGGQRVLHFVSDFRDRDWTTGPGAEELRDEVKGILADGISVSLLDVAAPARGTTGKVALSHDNLAIVDLKADARVAIEDDNVEFTATVMNYGQAASTGKLLKVTINGEDSPGSDQIVDAIPPGGKAELKFPLRFASRRKGGTIDPKADAKKREAMRRAEREFNHVRVFFDQREDTGLNADNVRDMVIEVRRRVPALVVDGNRPEGKGDGSDLTHLRAFVDASGNYDLEEVKLADLERADLELYPSIFLVNVAELPEAVIKRLKAYVEGGGSLCYFLGEEVKSDHYNTALFKAGLFPVLLTDRFFDPLDANNIKDPTDREKAREKARQTDKKPKILFPDKEHSVVRRLAQVTPWFRYLSVNVYWKAQPRSTWDADGKQAQQLIVLPNTAGIETYRARAMQLVEQARAAVNRLAVRDAAYSPYSGLLDDYVRKVRNTLAAGELYFVAEVLEDMLNNQGVKDDKTKPSMAELWKTADLRPLWEDIKLFREQILYGDPLLVSRKQGKGRVVAMLTTAGTSLRRGVGAEELVQWNDFGVQGLVGHVYPLFLLDLHRYLISEGEAPNRLLGEGVEFSVDAKRYERKLKWTFEPQPDLAFEKKVEAEKYEEDMVAQEGQFTFSLPEASRRRPGVFRFVLTAIGEGPADDRQETKAFAYNVDALAESDLKRAISDRLTPEGLPPADGKRGTFRLTSFTEPPPTFQDKQPDASESPWLYLFFILILVVEQAMAVHLSYHLKGSEAAAPAASGPQPVAA